MQKRKLDRDMHEVKRMGKGRDLLALAVRYVAGHYDRHGHDISLFTPSASVAHAPYSVQGDNARASGPSWQQGNERRRRTQGRQVGG
jgi:hypothetical protein